MLYGGANAGEVKLNEKSEYDSNKYSTYIEISYPLISKGSVKLNGFLGGGFAFNPGKRSLGQGTFLYGNGKNDFDIVNIGFSASKNIKVFSAHIPLSFTTMWNPSNKYARIQFATTLFWQIFFFKKLIPKKLSEIPNSFYLLLTIVYFH